MRMISTFAAFTMMLATSGVALADDDDLARGSQTLPSSADLIKTEMDRLGYDVLKLKADDGYLKARIVDRDSRGVVQATFDPATGELLRAKPE